MSISSIYLPNEGLQGEKIPSHILWSYGDIEKIVITIPKWFSLKDIYNSKWSMEGNQIIITSVECEGYVGLSFETDKTDSSMTKLSMKYDIKFKGLEIISEEKEIVLFSPELVVDKIPKKIVVNFEEDYVSDYIKISNRGRGTSLITFEPKDENDTKLIHSENYGEKMIQFIQDIKDEIRSVLNEFPYYDYLIDGYLEFLDKNILRLDLEARKKYLDHMKEFKDVLSTDHDFNGAIIEAFTKAFTKNREYLLEINRLGNMLDSMMPHNIMLLNPFDTLELKPGENVVKLKINSTDRVLNLYDDIELEDIVLESNEENELFIFDLLDRDDNK